MVFAFAIAAVASWLCALILTPGVSHLSNAAEQRLYIRALGRHHRVTFMAFILTALVIGVLGASLAHPSHAASAKSQRGQPICVDLAVNGPVCYTVQADGRWRREQLLSDGTWRMLGFVDSPPPKTEKGRVDNP